MFAVLADIVVEVVAAGRVGGDDEIGFVGTAVGEHDGRLVVALEQIEHLGRQRAVEVGSPDRAVVRGIFDDGAELQTSGASISSSRAIGQARR